MTREEAYWEGFINKCAELGVDPEALIKQAQLGATISAGARKAMAVLLKLLRRKLPSGAAAILGGSAPRAAIPKAVSAAGRFAGGAAASPVNLFRALFQPGQLGVGIPVPRTRAGGLGELSALLGTLGAGAAGTVVGAKRLLGGGKDEAATGQPSEPAKRRVPFSPGTIDDRIALWKAKGGLLSAEAPSGMLGPGGVHPSMKKDWEAKGWGPEGNPEILKLMKALQQR